ncbi:MAG TPA: helix-turn-helix domain-containing protein [Polyangiaceae bacterium]|nr:helix-turn-helix domain-containing protein [Polyangiaceae bacterium]
MTRGEFRTLMREAAFHGAAEALAELKVTVAAPALLSVQEMAQQLGVSRSKVNAMRLAGCPAVRLGSIFRFSPPAVLAWLEKQARGDAP